MITATVSVLHNKHNMHIGSELPVAPLEACVHMPRGTSRVHGVALPHKAASTTATLCGVVESDD